MPVPAQPQPTPISDLFEAHLTVTDLDRAIAFYRDGLALELAQVFAQPKVAFFWIGAPGKSMLGLWEAGPVPFSMNRHLAFRSHSQTCTPLLLDCRPRASSPETSPANQRSNQLSWPGCPLRPSISTTPTKICSSSSPCCPIRHGLTWAF
jgi:hypothetical protein